MTDQRAFNRRWLHSVLEGASTVPRDAYGWPGVPPERQPPKKALAVSVASSHVVKSVVRGRLATDRCGDPNAEHTQRRGHVDIYSRQKRSEIMASIRATNTRPELLVRRTLHAMGYRFRLHREDLPGRPDIVLSAKRIAVFVHGCFWHHHRGCQKARLPTTNAAFWRGKIEGNVRRDKAAIAALVRAGWHPILVWECEIKTNPLDGRLRRAISVASSRPTSATGRTVSSRR